MATKITQPKTTPKADSDSLATQPDSQKTTQKEPSKTTTQSQKAVLSNKTQSYTVQWTLNHNNQSYLAGSEIELDNATAKPLVAAGVLVAK